MKQIVRLRRRDGVTQRYRVGRRQRIRRMAVSPGEFKEAFAKDSRTAAKAAINQLTKKQMKDIDKYLKQKEDVGQTYGIVKGSDISEAIREGIYIEKQKRRGKKNFKEPDSKGWKAFTKADPTAAAKILGQAPPKKKR
jgi:hypothetical protein